MKKDYVRQVVVLEDLITEDFGAVGTPERDQFEMECDAFIIGEQLKDENPSFIPSPAGTSYMASGSVCYNSPSRFAIFETIYWSAFTDMSTMIGPSEEEMWEAFLEYDVVNDHLPY